MDEPSLAERGILCRVKDCLYFCSTSTALSTLCRAAGLQNPNQQEFPWGFMPLLVLAQRIWQDTKEQELSCRPADAMESMTQVQDCPGL